MNPYRKIKYRTTWRKNPRFGGRCFIGAHRYAYYVDGELKYYFSERPYTIEDAKKWKNYWVVMSGIFSLLFSSFVFCGLDWMDTFNGILAYLIMLGFTVYYVIMFVKTLPLHPEEDPMLQSFQCPTDFEKPIEDTCKYCGRPYVSGIHEFCPHCKNLI